MWPANDNKRSMPGVRCLLGVGVGDTLGRRRFLPLFFSRAHGDLFLLMYIEQGFPNCASCLWEGGVRDINSVTAVLML